MPGLRSFGPPRLGIGTLAPVRRVVVLNGKLTAAGDSNTAIPGQNGTDSWVTRIAADYPLLTTKSLGIGGMLATDMNAEKSNSDPNVGVYVNFDSGEQFNVATIMGGTNDLFTADSAATIYGYITSWVTGVKAQGFTTIVMTVLWGSGYDAAQLVRLDALNALIMANAAAAHGVADVRTAVGTDGANFSDSLHTSTAGAQIIANTVAAKMLQIL